MHIIFSPGAAEVATVLVRAIGITLLAGAWTKIRNLEAFRLICGTYPGAAVLGLVTVSTGVIAGELASGAMLLVPDRTVGTMGAIVAAVWIGIATTAVAERWRRGETRFQCGCGTDLAGYSNARWLVIRNLLLIATLLIAAVSTAATPSNISQSMALTLAAAGIIMAAHLLAAARLTRARIREWPIHT